MMGGIDVDFGSDSPDLLFDPSGGGTAWLDAAFDLP
jgi:hypothetical protein